MNQDTLIDYLAGELEKDEQLRVEQELEKSAALREELAGLKELFLEVKELPDLSPSPKLRQNFDQMLAAEVKKTDGHPKVIKLTPPNWLWQSIAAAIILAIGVFAGQKINQFQMQNEEMAAIREELNQTKLAMQQLMQQTSTSRRIKAVNLTYDLPKADKEIIENLEYLLNRDESANVRLAALDALSQFAIQTPEARQILINALRHQDKPVVQIALIQVLVKLEANGAVPLLDELIENGQITDKVRDEAELGRFKLEKSL